MKKPLHLLLYESDAPFDAALLGALKQFSWVETCKVVNSKKDFNEALKAFTPDAILFATIEDISSCTEAVTSARKQYHAIPFIIIVDKESNDIAQQVIDSGANDYLTRADVAHLPVMLKSALKLQQTENEKERLSKSLKNTKNNYDTIFLKGPTPKWIYEIETLRFLEVNNAAIAKYGYSREEFLQMTLLDIRPEEEVPLLKEYFANHPIPKGTLKEQWHHRKKNGEIILVETIAHTVLFDNRKARMVTLHDVTEIYKAKLQILQSESNLKIIFDNTSEGFLLLDENAKIVTFNNSAEVYSLIKKTKPFEIGYSIFEFIDPKRVEAFKDIVASALNGQNIHFERCIKSKDESITWIAFSVTPVFVDKKIKGVCVTGRNITYQKRIEEQREFDRSNLKALINNTHDFMWSIDRNFNLITSNEAFSKAFKIITGHEAVQGVNVTVGKFNPHSIKVFKEYYQRALDGESFTIASYRDIPLVLWSDVSFYPIYNQEEVIGAAIFSRDVSQRIHAEEEQKAYTRSLEEMLFKISHKLRVPIANLIGLGNLAEETNNTPEEVKLIMGYIKPTITVLDTFSRDLTRFIEEILIANKSEIIQKEKEAVNRSTKQK
jgi:PAS domain S-box-containing protein